MSKSQTSGDHSPSTVASGEKSSAQSAGRDIFNTQSYPDPIARLKLVSARSRWVLENTGDAAAHNVRWAVEGDQSNVVATADPEIGKLSAGATKQLGVVSTSLAGGETEIVVTWTRADGSPDHIRQSVS